MHEIRRHNRTADIIETTHRALYLQNLTDENDRRPLSFLRGKYIGAISGIARPESFEDKLTALGAELVITKRFADHHRFSDEELRDFVQRAIRRDLDLIVTTEKDSVRFPYRFESPEVPVYFLRVEIEIIDGDESWKTFVSQVCEPQPVVAPGRYYS